MVLYTRGNGALYKRKWCFIQEEMVLYVVWEVVVAMFFDCLKAFKSIKRYKKPNDTQNKLPYVLAKARTFCCSLCSQRGAVLFNTVCEI